MSVSRISVDPKNPLEPTRDHPSQHPKKLCDARQTKVHPQSNGGEDASIFFVGTATTIMLAVMPYPLDVDKPFWLISFIVPNFLHSGDHAHLGPGVTAERRTNPAIELHDIPPIHFVLLSHYHADHFDEKVEKSLRRDLPIISTTHAKEHLESKGDESFTDVYDLDAFQSIQIDTVTPRSPGVRTPAIKITAMPGEHVPPGPLAAANDLLGAVPPTNGWLVELGHSTQNGDEEDEFTSGYRIYISGDTLMCDELKKIPERYAERQVDLMLIHLGGTTIPSPSIPLLMVTMDAKQGVELLRLIKPDITIPIHYDDYDVFLSPLSEFQEAVEENKLSDRVVYLDRKDVYRFKVA